MKVFIEMAKDKGYSRESPVPAMNTRNQILVLMGVTEVISKTELWIIKQCPCIPEREERHQQKESKFQ